MKATFIVKNVTQEFYTGFGSSIVGIDNMPPRERFHYLNKKAAEGALEISLKIGNGSFRDRVELNQLLRKEELRIDYKDEPRRGYRLLTFEFE